MMDLEEFISQDEDELFGLLKDQKLVSSFPGLNWLGLAEYSELKATRLISEKQNDQAEKWLFLALKVYEYLLESNHRKNRYFSYLQNLIKIKVNAINYFGWKTNDELRDYDLFVNAILKFLDRYDLSDVEKKCEQLNLISKEDMLALRRLKNILCIVEGIEDWNSRNVIEIDRWLPIKDRLP